MKLFGNLIRFSFVLLVVCLLWGCGDPYDKVANLDSRGRAIVCLGDSITHGYGATKGNDYVSVLSRRLGVEVVNSGVDGDTTERALARLDRDVLRLRPRLVIVELGGNDLLRKTPKAETFVAMDAIVGRCVGAGSMVVLVHCKFVPLGSPYRDEFSAIAERHGAVFVENALKGVWGNPAMMYDQIHPNDRGYAVLAQRVGDAVVALMSESASRSK